MKNITIESTQSQGGFIQIPILIAIVMGILVVGGGGYAGVREYKKNQEITKEEIRLVQEKEAQITVESQVTPEVALVTQEKVSTSTSDKVVALHKEVETLKKEKTVASKPEVAGAQTAGIGMSLTSVMSTKTAPLAPEPAPIPVPLAAPVQPGPAIVVVPPSPPPTQPQVYIPPSPVEPPPSLAPDTTAPSIPTNLSATPISDTKIALTWNASTDNVGVVGYRVFQSRILVRETSQTFYTDASLMPGTSYSYTVSAYDAAGNSSEQSPFTYKETLPAPTPPLPPPAPLPPPPSPTYSDYEFTYQWTTDGYASTLTCPQTTRNIEVRKAVFVIPSSELEKIEKLFDLQQDGYSVVMKGPLLTFREPDQQSRTYNLVESPVSTFVFSGGIAPICHNGASAVISMFADITDTTTQGRNWGWYLNSIGLDPSIHLTPVMEDWEIWDNTTSLKVKIP